MSLSCLENKKIHSKEIKIKTSLGKHCLAVCKQAFVLQFESFKLLLKNRVFQEKTVFILYTDGRYIGLKKKKSPP